MKKIIGLGPSLKGVGGPTFLGLLICLVFIAGCQTIFIGVGAVTGYLLSIDTASGIVQAKYHDLWNLCLDKIKDMGAVNLRVSESKGIIKAKINEYAVALQIHDLNPQTQKLVVSARKYFLPKPLFAQTVFLRITDELK